jgi:hypothetical protein
MTISSANTSTPDQSSKESQTNERASVDLPMSDEAAQQALDHGDNEKIDQALDELDVSTTKSGKIQSNKPDTEGSNSSSKNLDDQDDWRRARRNPLCKTDLARVTPPSASGSLLSIPTVSVLVSALPWSVQEISARTTTQGMAIWTPTPVPQSICPSTYEASAPRSPWPFLDFRTW